MISSAIRMLPEGRFSLIFNVVFQALCLGLFLFWYKHTPAPSKAVLIIAIIAVIVTFFEPAMQWQKCIWLALIFALALVENAAIKQDRKEANERETKLAILTQGTANAATQAVTSISILSSKVDDYSGQLRDAEKNKDTKAIARIQAEKDAAQRKLLLTMAVGVAEQLQRSAGAWKSRDEALYVRSSLADSEAGKQMQELSRVSSDQLRPLMTTGDYLREQLLQKFPALEQNDEGKIAASIFKRAIAGETFTNQEVFDVGGYLFTLVGRARNSGTN